MYNKEKFEQEVINFLSDEFPNNKLEIRKIEKGEKRDLATDIFVRIDECTDLDDKEVDNEKDGGEKIISKIQKRISLDDLYDIYYQNNDFERIKVLLKAMIPDEISSKILSEMLINFEDNIEIRLFDWTVHQNKFVSDIATKDFLIFKKVLSIFKELEDSTLNCYLTSHLLELVCKYKNLTKDDVWKIAYRNLINKKYRIMNLDRLLNSGREECGCIRHLEDQDFWYTFHDYSELQSNPEMCVEEARKFLFSSSDFNSERSLYVLTNEKSFNGSSVLLLTELLKTISMVFNSSYFILPSSRHEVLLLKDTGDIDADAVRGIVKEINDTMVKADEILAYSIFRYDKEKKLLSVVDG